MVNLYFGQLKTLVYKNFLYKKKEKTSTYFVVLYFIMIAFILVQNFRLNEIFNADEEINSILSINVSNTTDINLEFKSNPVLSKGYNIGFVIPENNNDLVDSIMSSNLFENMNLSPMLFENDKLMEEYYTSNTNSLIAGLVIDPDFSTYTLRVDGLSVPDPTLLVKDFNSVTVKDNSTNYLSIFAPLQMAIDQALIRLKTNDDTIEISSSIGKLPLADYVRKPTLFFGDVYVIFLIEFTYILPIVQIVYYIVSENERKVKSLLLSIGMHPSAFWLSWLFSDGLFLSVLTILLCTFLFVYQTFIYKITIVLLILLLLYSMSLVCISILISTFFKDCKVAYSCIDVMSIVLVIPYLVFYYCPSIAKIVGSIFISPVSLGIGLEKLFIIQKDSSYTGNIFSEKDILISIGLLLWNCLFYFVIAVIIDAINSEENQSFISLRRKPKNTLEYDIHSIPFEADFEKYHGNEESCVDVRNIFREFHHKKTNYLALKNVSFKAYKNEIFCILGHNGAGKSTLVKIMTGLIKSNNGSVLYDGQDFEKNNKDIRRNMGICSQENILFDLSVEENLKIFGGLKGVKFNMEEILQKIDLTNKKHSNTERLSGGQKRKLCIGIAILGDPKYLFLDEPSTGLDPVSRREIWQLLSSIKKDKIIFLTTHYMDEADILADRKLILSKGVIRCLGSSIYLKNHFNMKYHITIQTNQPKNIDQLIKRIIPEADYEMCDKISSSSEEGHYSTQNNYTWKLPIQSTPRFKQLFHELNQPEYQSIVYNYYIQSPSLGELFINLTEKNTNNDESNENAVTINMNNNNNVLITKEYPELPDPSQLHKVSSYTKFKRLILLRYKIYFRNITFLFNITLIPIIFSIGIFIVLKFINNKGLVNFDERDVSANSIYTNNVWNFDFENSNMNKNLFESHNSLQNIDFNSISQFNSYNTSSLQSKEYVSSLSGKVVDNSKYSFELYYNETKLHAIPAMVNEASNMILSSRNIDSKITVKTRPFPYFDILSYQSILNVISLFIGFILIYNLIKYGAQVVQERQELIFKQLRLNGVNNMTYWLSSMVTDSSFAIFSCLMIVLVGVLFKYEPFFNIYAIIILIVTSILGSIGSLLVQYCLNFKCDSKINAYTYLPIINLIMTAIFVFGNLIINSLYTMRDYNNEEITLENILFNKPSVYFQTTASLLFPPYSIIGKINSLTWVKFLNEINSQLFPLSFTQYFSLNKGISLMILATFISIFLYFGLLMILDRNFNILKAPKDVNVPKSLLESYDKYTKEHDQSVKDETDLVKEKYYDFPLSILGVNKEFKASSRNVSPYKKTWNYGEIHRSVLVNHSKYVKTIIENVSFHVNSNECFGLLGPNGSGKTSLLNMLIGLNAPSFGNIYYNGKNIKDISDLTIGYCNQEDILWKELTIREHLEFFLELRGFPKEHLSDYATHYIQYCDLEEHQDKTITQLSGGTKRKLSVLLAVCGYPKIIILDEPTAGMDPYTRRFIWNIIKDIKEKEQSSMILTTHSMEEAESLCDRLTILLNGRLSCIGSPNDLTMTHAKDYIIDVDTNHLQSFHQAYFENGDYFPDANKYVWEPQTETRSKYFVSKDYDIEKLYELLEKARNEGLINDYILTGSTLDDVFLNLVKNSTPDDN